MDYALYTDLKSKNLVFVDLAPDSPALVEIKRKQFDPNTGEEVSPEVFQVEISKLQEHLASTQARLTGLEAIIADATALESALTPKTPVDTNTVIPSETTN